jgi:endo-1,4-beta-xylanase
MCFAHPSVEGILMWGFWQGKHWRPNAFLWKKDWTPTDRND